MPGRGSVILLILSLAVACFSNSDEKFQFYGRNELSLDNVITYADYIKIVNYKDKSLTTSQMYLFAKQYIDTVKADKVVKEVTFVGQGPFSRLPDNGFDEFDEIRKHCLLSFGFTYDTVDSKKRQLKNVSIWQTSDHETYYYKFSKDKAVIDSLFASNKPFSSE